MKFEEVIKERLAQFEEDLDDLRHAPHIYRASMTDKLYNDFVNDLKEAVDEFKNERRTDIKYIEAT